MSRRRLRRRPRNSKRSRPRSSRLPLPSLTATCSSASAASCRCPRSAIRASTARSSGCSAIPDYLTRVFGRAQRYLHHVANEVEARGLPADLALLPVVESAFNPFAYSRAHASGTLAIHRPDRRALRPAPQLLAGPAPRRARVHARRAGIPHPAQRALRRRLVPRDRGVQLRFRQYPARDQPQQGDGPADRFLLAIVACRDARLRAEAGRAREDGGRAGPLRVLPAAGPGHALLPRGADGRTGGPAPDGGARGCRSGGTARAEPVLESLDDRPGRPAPRAGPGGGRRRVHREARCARRQLARAPRRPHCGAGRVARLHRRPLQGAGDLSSTA